MEIFPYSLIPNPSNLRNIARLATSDELTITEGIRIRQDERRGWILEYRGEDFFSFDMPTDMFRLYERQSRLLSRSTLEMQGLLVNLGERVNDNLDNRFHRVSFRLPRKELDQLLIG